MKLIDGHDVIEHAEVNGESREFIRKLMDYIEDADVVEPKTGDLISREDAIKAIFSKPACHGSDGSWYHSDDIRDAINSTPSADRPQGEWIPCSERLPEPQVEVLYSLEGCVSVAFMTNRNYTGETVELHWEDLETGITICPEAWMPLPEPWEGENDERVR